MKRFLLILTTLLVSGGSYGQVVVSGANGIANGTNYTSITNAVNAIKGNTQVGYNPILTITSDIAVTTTETITEWDWVSLTIKPSGIRTISGDRFGSSIILFNGADRVVIDGLNSGGNSLTITNYSTGVGPGGQSTGTIGFVLDATYNTITNCTVLGSASKILPTSSGSENGGTIYFGLGSVTGNDYNTISYCKIGPAGENLPSIGILNYGTVDATNVKCNSNITIDNCEIYDFFRAAGCAGIYAATWNTDWTISNNKIYQTAPRTFTSGGTMYGIYFFNIYADNVQITGNTIGYSNNSGTGTLTLLGSDYAGAFRGIQMTTSSTATNACSITGNNISNVSLTSSTGTFVGIYNGSGYSSNTININSNTVNNIETITTTGALTAIYAGNAATLSASDNTLTNITQSGSGSLLGINMYAFYTGTFNSNTFSDFVINNPASTASIWGIIGEGSGNRYVFTANGNAISGFSTTSALVPTICGIREYGQNSTKVFQNNTIYNFSAQGESTLLGISASSSSGNGAGTDISGNVIHSFSNAKDVIGISSTPVVNGTISIYKNKIYGLSTSNPDGTAKGIYVGTSVYHVIYNNIIGELSSTAFTSSTSPYLSLAGIWINAGTSNIYNNTVFIGSTTSSGVNASMAGIYTSTSPTILMQNNIIVNLANPKGSGNAVAYMRSSNTLTTYSTSSNNNCFYGTSGLFWDGTNLYNTLASYKTAMGVREKASYNYNVTPLFVSTTGANANYLHIIPSTPNNPLESGGINIATFVDDFDVDARPGPSGSVNGGATKYDIGADEFDGFPLLPPTGPATQSYCASEGKLVSDLTATLTGTNIIWYDAATAGNVITSTTTLITRTYYASQTINGNESPTRLAVAVTINTTPAAPTGSASQTYCSSQGKLVSDLTATLTGANIIWYDAATNGNMINSTTVLSTGNYYASQTVNGCESTLRKVVAVTVNSTPLAPTGSASQTYCSSQGKLVSDLTATLTGANIIWYDAATNGNMINSTTVLSTGNYYASQTVNGCESTLRKVVAVTVNSTPLAPTGSASQTYCSSQGKLVSDLTATLTGANIIWYDAATNGNMINSTTALSTGTYYASQTVNGCESILRKAVAVTVNATPLAPTGSASQTYCSSQGKLVSDLTATLTGANIIWYDAATNGNMINSTTVLSTGTYYASQTVNGCESTLRKVVAVTVNSTPLAPTGSASQTYCSSQGKLVSDLTATLTGANIIWYDAATNGNMINSTTVLSTGTYYASQTVNGCESTLRKVVAVTVNSTPLAPTGSASQTYCSSQGKLVSDLTATLTGANIIWYDAATNGNMINSTTVLSTGTYYASQTVNGCESTLRKAVAVTINTMPTAPTSITGTFSICEGSSTILTATGGSEGDGCSYQWGTGSTVGSNIIAGETNAGYSTLALSSNTTFWVRRVGNTACTNTTGGITQLVTVTNSPTAIISYSGSPFSNDISTLQSVSISGTNAYTGGSYSATPVGLTINSSTGAITPNTSAINDYQVTYTIPASGACGVETATTIVTITSPCPATSTFTGSGSWNLVGNWDNGLPCATTNVIIDGTGLCTINSTANCKNLTINPEKYLTVNESQTLSINGQMTIKSTAVGTGSFINNGTVNYAMDSKIERYLTGSQWHLVSSPVTVGVAGVFHGIWLRSYNESTNTFGVYIVPDETPMPTGQGFSVWTNSANEIRTFTGLVNNGTVTPSVQLTGAAGPSTGWNLIGNPYPSAIDWNASSGWAKTNIANSIYVWNNNQYATYIGGIGTNGGSRYIAMEQGFFVQATAPGPSISMNNNVRVHNSVSYMKTNDEDPTNIIRVKVNKDSNSDETVIAIRENGSTVFNPETDAVKLPGSTTSPQMHTIKSDNSFLAISALASINEIIGKYIYLDIAETGSHQLLYTHTLSETNIPRLFDTKTQTVVEPNTPYSFNATVGDANTRFQFIESLPMSVDNSQNSSNITIWESNKILYILNSSNNAIKQVIIYGTDGKIVHNGIQTTTDLSNLSSGMYMVRVTTENKTQVKKIIIK